MSINFHIIICLSCGTAALVDREPELDPNLGTQALLSSSRVDAPKNYLKFKAGEAERRPRNTGSVINGELSEETQLVVFYYS